MYVSIDTISVSQHIITRLSFMTGKDIWSEKQQLAGLSAKQNLDGQLSEKETVVNPKNMEQDCGLNSNKYI